MPTGHAGKQPFAMSYRLRPEHHHGRSKWYTGRSAWAVDRARDVYACDPENLRDGGMHYRSLFDQFHIDANLYQCNESMVASPLFRVIQNCFPKIASFLIKVKSKGHEALARMLQTLESELMIDRLGCSLIATHPNEPVQPINDALLTTKRFANQAVELIKAQFALLGLNPHVTYEAL